MNEGSKILQSLSKKYYLYSSPKDSIPLFLYIEHDKTFDCGFEFTPQLSAKEVNDLITINTYIVYTSTIYIQIPISKTKYLSKFYAWF